MKMAQVLEGSAGLAGVQWALQGRPARTVLRGTLEGLLLETGLGACRLNRAKYKPGLWLTAYYDATLEISGKRKIRPVEVNWTAQDFAASDETRPDPHLMQAEASQRGLMAPFQQLVAEAPGWGMRVQVSPLDVQFPKLVRLSDPEYVREMMATVSGPLNGRQKLNYAVTPVRYRPGQRHVLRYALMDETGLSHQTLFAKLYNNLKKGDRSFRIAAGVSDWLAAHGEGVNGARPLVFLPEEGIALYPKVSGTALSRRLQFSARELRPVLSQAGSALLSMHCGLDGLAGELELKTFADEVKAIARASEHVQVLLPAAGAQIDEILERAREIHERMPQEPPTFTHSDFKADHLWLAPDGMTLIDFDTCSRADPALDVGKFLADLQWWYAVYRKPGVEQAQQWFLEGYFREGPPERLRRARLYEVLILVKITVRRVRLFDPHWAQKTTDLIGRARAMLDGLQVSGSGG